MYCKQCGTEMPENSKFCNNCGYFVRQKINLQNTTNNQFIDIYSHSSDSQQKPDVETRYSTNNRTNYISKNSFNNIKATILPNQSYNDAARLLYSTEGMYSSVGIVVGIILYFIGAICFYASFKNFSSTSPSPIIAFIPLALFMIPLMNAMNMKRSYVEIYENKLIGFSLPKNLFDGKCGNFSLTYDKIISIEYQRDTVTFKFTSGEYTVQAKKCANNVVKICEQQMKLYR